MRALSLTAFTLIFYVRCAYIRYYTGSPKGDIQSSILILIYYQKRAPHFNVYIPVVQPVILDIALGHNNPCYRHRVMVLSYIWGCTQRMFCFEGWICCGGHKIKLKSASLMKRNGPFRHLCNQLILLWTQWQTKLRKMIGNKINSTSMFALF